MLSRLALHTELLESFDWDEQELEQAIERTIAVFTDLQLRQVDPGVATVQASRSLMSDFTPDQARLLVKFVVEETWASSRTPEA